MNPSVILSTRSGESKYGEVAVASQQRCDYHKTTAKLSPSSRSLPQVAMLDCGTFLHFRIYEEFNGVQGKDSGINLLDHLRVKNSSG